MLTLLDFLTLGLKIAQTAADIAPIASQMHDTLTSGDDVTQADFDRLHAIDAENRARLNREPVG